jgi:ferredoxin-NADP reductase/MOSC domain-containing protein YiiM
VHVRKLNIDGDGQGDLAGHGGEHRAVMVYQLDSYRYWENVLQRHDLDYGCFGENLTIEGLSDSEACIGDRYRIGSTLFEVTQPRVTCYRVGIRLNNPQMPALLVSHRRPGFYFRVVEEGEIGAGDVISRVAEGPERISVAEVDALLYLPGHPRNQLERALRVPALSEGWKGSLQALLATSEQSGNAGLAPSSTLPPAWSGFRPLRVKVLRRESVDVVSIVFESVDGVALPAPLAGQFLVFKLEINGHSGPVMRSYSISGSKSEGTYRISVKRASGSGSQFFHDQVQIGDVLQVSAPRGSFTLGAGSNPIVLLSAGIGVTPVLSMLHWLAEDIANQAREIWWCYGARSSDEHPFAAEVQSLLDTLPQSHSFTAYSKPGVGDQMGKDFDISGRLNVELLKQIGVPRFADFYVCGPPAFLSEIVQGLTLWGVADSHIHSESFGSESSITPGIAAVAMNSPHLPAGPVGDGPRVSFTRSGLTVSWNSRFGSLLELCEACDIPVRWSCRVGVCHMCETGLIDGRVNYAPEPLDHPSGENVLICCSTPMTDIELNL